jgi:hypothetical protein
MRRPPWAEEAPRSPHPHAPNAGRLGDSTPNGEHAALLEDGPFDALRRKDDFFEDGVATVFGLRRGEAELHAFVFQAARFTPEEARRWLDERGFRVVRFAEAGEGE